MARNKIRHRIVIALRIAFWGYIIFSTCPWIGDLLKELLDSGVGYIADIFWQRGFVGDRHLSGNEEFRQWLHEKAQQGDVSNRHLQGNKEFNDIIDGLKEKGDIRNRHLEGNAKANQWLRDLQDGKIPNNPKKTVEQMYNEYMGLPSNYNAIPESDGSETKRIIEDLIKYGHSTLNLSKYGRGSK